MGIYDGIILSMCSTNKVRHNNIIRKKFVLRNFFKSSGDISAQSFVL